MVQFTKLQIKAGQSTHKLNCNFFICLNMSTWREQKAKSAKKTHQLLSKLEKETQLTEIDLPKRSATYFTAKTELVPNTRFHSTKLENDQGP